MGKVIHNRIATLNVSAGGLEKEAETLEDKLQVLKSLIKKPKKVTKITDTGGQVPEKENRDALNVQKGPPILHASAAIYGGGLVKKYPGAHNLDTLRILAWNSTVVYAIVTYRRHQLTKRDLILVPKEKEPPVRLTLFDYDINDIMYLPYLEEHEKRFLVTVFRRIDPDGSVKRKEKLIKEKFDAGDLTRNEYRMLKYLDDKHWKFYNKRREDVRNILRFLRNPDPYFSEESSWTYLLSMVLEDLLLLDRGVIIKIRDNNGNLVALTPVDGATIFPKFTPEGYIQSYVQLVDGHEVGREYDKNDVILIRMNYTPDRYSFGYGIPNMEILYRAVLADIFIDKGNLDYYRKGGSVPEGFLVVEPPGNTEEGYIAYDKEHLDALQRQIQSIIMSDFTQVPLLSGGKFTWIDLKGKRRDMQFKELAEYLTRKICAVFQVSPQDVGVIADVNRSTAEVQASLTRSKGLETLAASISDAITRGVIDELRKEQDLKLWWSEADINKEKEEWIVRQGQLQQGVITINEIRAEMGRDPVPWGDVPFQGLKNWTPPQEEEQQIPGLGGLAGGIQVPQQPPPLPAAPTAPNKGAEIFGQAPGTSMGTPPKPKVKSLDSILKSIQELEQELDVEPLVDSLLLEGREIEESDEEISLQDVVDSVANELISDVKFSKDGIYILTRMPVTQRTVGKILINILRSDPDITWKVVDIDSDKAIVSLFTSGGTKELLTPYPGSTENSLLKKVYEYLSLFHRVKHAGATTIVITENKEDFEQVKGAKASNTRQLKALIKEMVSELGNMEALLGQLLHSCPTYECAELVVDNIPNYAFEAMFGPSFDVDAQEVAIALTRFGEKSDELLKRIKKKLRSVLGKLYADAFELIYKRGDYTGAVIAVIEWLKEVEKVDEEHRPEALRRLLFKLHWYNHDVNDELLEFIAEGFGIENNIVKQINESVKNVVDKWFNKFKDLFSGLDDNVLADFNEGFYDLDSFIMNELNRRVPIKDEARDYILATTEAIENFIDNSSDFSFEIEKEFDRLMGLLFSYVAVLLKRYKTAVSELIAFIDPADELPEEYLDGLEKELVNRNMELDDFEAFVSELATVDDALGEVLNTAYRVIAGEEVAPLEITIAKSLLQGLKE